MTNNKLLFKERRLTLQPQDWVVPPNCNIKVTYKVDRSIQNVDILSSRTIHEYLKMHWPDIDLYESFLVIYLNRRNKAIGVRQISTGGISGTVADVRLILQIALLLNATGIILSHNHPSGSVAPSREDETLTKKIKEAALLHDIRVMDHVIIAEDTYYSFADEGLI